MRQPEKWRNKLTTVRSKTTYSRRPCSLRYKVGALAHLKTKE